MDNWLPLHRQSIPDTAIQYVSDVMASGRLSAPGKYSSLCEDWLQNTLGCQKAIMATSCTAALQVAAYLCDFQPGDEVIVPAWTFPSTVDVFVRAGAIPVLVDVCPDTLSITAPIIEAAITPATRAIVVVHYGGTVTRMEPILALARKHNMLVIEDAAQAILSKTPDGYAGSLGDMAAVSFHATKSIGCGEGGALLLNNNTLVERAEIILAKGTNHAAFRRGEVNSYGWAGPCVGGRPAEVVSALLWAMLEMAEDLTRQRKARWVQYAEHLNSVCNILTADLARGNGHVFALWCRDAAERTAHARALNAQGIEATGHYGDLSLTNMARQYARMPMPLDVTSRAANTLLRLPLYSSLSSSDVERVIQAVTELTR